eukprot:303980-Chlamydomonas_euryale.AAC.30
MLSSPQDVSSTCIDQLHSAAYGMGLPEKQRKSIQSFVCDSTSPTEAHRFVGLGADAVLVMFTLSAVTPMQQEEMLRNAERALRPGGGVDRSCAGVQPCACVCPIFTHHCFYNPDKDS